MTKRNYWLVKSEPSAYSFADLMKEPNRTAYWDGVRNFQARNNLRAMKVGDGVLFYHSQSDPNAVVGIAVVAREAYPDHTAWDPKSEHPDPKSTRDRPVWFMVDIRGEAELKRPVPLAEIKATPTLKHMMLVKAGRLSVQPVTETEWKTILRMGGMEKA
ncbi:MAG: EVE domain-containing protein [SAR202 cluster bacterium]|nr:EVE domain-containing protein [SAR202 cluster bacterium]